MKLALVHTSPVHVAAFGKLLAEAKFTGEAEHLVYEDLLERAQMAGGVTPELSAELHNVLGAVSADLALCTCSTLGAAAEAFEGMPVLRVDRALAAEAAARGGRVVVLTTLKATLNATAELFREEAAKVPDNVRLRFELCSGAWAHFEADDVEAYHQSVAACLDSHASDADVVALAQASMAGAARYVSLDVPILSSPELGVRTALNKLAQVS